MLLDCCSTFTYTNRPSCLFCVFSFACWQQLITNFQILMYFHALMPLSITSSSGILVALPAPLIVALSSYIAFSTIWGQSLCPKTDVFLGQKRACSQNFPGASSPDPHSLLTPRSHGQPRFFRLEPHLCMMSYNS